PHLSTEMRQRILSWRHESGLPVAEIAQLACCSERTVYKILHLYREYGTVQNPLAIPRGRARKLDTSDLDYMFSLLQANPSMYLDELQEHLMDER
ncbi:hypothetical protein BDW22DRAFT_1297215, partial [Trametopsis cervina]